MPRTKNLGNAFENRRGELERINNAQAQYFAVTGEIEVDGVGEASANVLFPCLFTDKPRFHSGHELGPGQPVTSGSMPTAAITVLAWDQRVRDDGTVVYAGATLGIVTTGPAPVTSPITGVNSTAQVMVIQWHMDGVGLRGPVPDVSAT